MYVTIVFLSLQDAFEVQAQIENLELTLDTSEVEATAKKRLLKLDIQELQNKLDETKKEILRVENDLEQVRERERGCMRKPPLWIFFWAILVP